MSEQFEPYDKESKTIEFNPWEYKVTKEADSDDSIEVQMITELEALKQSAYQEGYDHGMQNAVEEIQSLKTNLLKWMELFKKPVLIIDEQLTQEVIKTIICLCQKSIAVELSIHPDKLYDLISKIKKELPALNTKKILKMHPEDIEWIKSNFSTKEIEGLHEILVPDTNLSRGDFYLQGEHSELDGRIETRLATLFDENIITDDLGISSSVSKGKENGSV